MIGPRRYYWKNKCMFCEEILDGHILLALPLIKAIMWALRCNWQIVNIMQLSHGREIQLMCPNCSYIEA